MSYGQEVAERRLRIEAGGDIVLLCEGPRGTGDGVYLGKLPPDPIQRVVIFENLKMAVAQAVDCGIKMSQKASLVVPEKIV